MSIKSEKIFKCYVKVLEDKRFPSSYEDMVVNVKASSKQVAKNVLSQKLKNWDAYSVYNIV